MKNKKIKILVINFILILIIDQIIKFVVFKLNKSYIIIPKILEIQTIKNTGMAFGINSGNMKNIIITLLVLALIINFIKNQFELINNKTIISLSLLIGGGLSNLIDRIFRGGVFDFIKIFNFPIFNIADIAIVIGWVLLIINTIKFSINENKKEKNKG